MAHVGDIVQVGVDHRRASPDLIRDLHAARRDTSAAGCGSLSLPTRPLLRPETAEGGDVTRRPAIGDRPAIEGIEGWVGIVTCHRLELYLEGVPSRHAPEIFWSWLSAEPELRQRAAAVVSVRRGEEAARHLARTAAGLESVVLGEDQILAQVRQAYRAACEVRSSGPLLHRLFHAAFRAGRRVRAETELGRGARTLAGEAVAFASRSLGGLDGRSVLVIGTGMMGETVCTHLGGRGVGRLLIAGRSIERSMALAARFGGGVCAWSWIARTLPEVDAVIAASGAGTAVVESEWVEHALEARRRMTVVDLAVPPNVSLPSPSPAGLACADLEHLMRRLAESGSRSAEAVASAEQIVENELAAWMQWVRERNGRPAGVAEGGPGREVGCGCSRQHNPGSGSS
jgi:glutamyl-tRNA reductase